MNCWKLDGPIANWSDESAILSFDQSRPGNGLNVRLPAVVTKPTLHLFATDSPERSGTKSESPSQVHCGRNRIDATFAENEPWPAETHVTWHVQKTEPGRTVVDVVVSVVTQHLDARPELQLRTSLDASDVLVPDGPTITPNSQWNRVDKSPLSGKAPRLCPCVLFRLPGTDFSYLEMVHPGDFHRFDISKDSQASRAVLRHRLFACRLEKGVILRARLRGVLLPRDEDCSAAADIFQQLIAAAPPLGH